MTRYYIEISYVLLPRRVSLRNVRTDFQLKLILLVKIGGSFEKKVQSGATNLIRFYIALNWGEKCYFCHPKSKLGRYPKVADFGDNSFFVFKRMQIRLVVFRFVYISFVYKAFFCNISIICRLLLYADPQSIKPYDI